MDTGMEKKSARKKPNMNSARKKKTKIKTLTKHRKKPKQKLHCSYK
jgi:hypothetical protein